MSDRMKVYADDTVTLGKPYLEQLRGGLYFTVPILVNGTAEDIVRSETFKSAMDRAERKLDKIIEAQSEMAVRDYLGGG